MSSAETREPRSRRAEHKSRTRQALREAALKLFAKQGYDATTTEEIAEEAGVAARTFFRYFPTKESVLYFGERAWFETFATDVLACPPATSDLDAMREAFVRSAADIAARRRSLLLYERAVASSPTLRGLQRDHLQHNVAEVAEALAKRRGLDTADEGCTLLASVGLVTHRRALDQWLTNSKNGDLGRQITKEFELLARVLGST